MSIQRSYEVNSAEGSAPSENNNFRKGAWIFYLIGFFILSAVIVMLCLMWLPSLKYSATNDVPVKDSQTGGDIDFVESAHSKTNASKESYVSVQREKPESFTQRSTDTLTKSNLTPSTLAPTNSASGTDGNTSTTTPVSSKDLTPVILGVLTNAPTPTLAGWENVTSPPLVPTSSASGTDGNTSTTTPARTENDTHPILAPTRDDSNAPSNVSTTTLAGLEGVTYPPLATTRNYSGNESNTTPVTLKSGTFPSSAPTSDDSTAPNGLSTTTPVTLENVSSSRLASTTDYTNVPYNASTTTLATRENVTPPALASRNGYFEVENDASTTTKGTLETDALSTSAPTSDDSSAPNGVSTTTPVTLENISSPRLDSTTDSTNAPYNASTTTSTTRENITPSVLTSTSNYSEAGSNVSVTTEITLETDTLPTAAPTSDDSNAPTDVSTTLSSIIPPPMRGDERDSKLGNQIASKMLFYMNHSADACEDFYEYACGGFEADDLLSENDLEKQAARRIFDYAKKYAIFGEPKEFLAYHQSCLNYNNYAESDKIKSVKQAVAEVGKFYSRNEWKDEYFDLTSLLAQLLLHNSAPLFDITPDVAVEDRRNCEDRSVADKFTFRVGPPVLKNSLYVNRQEKSCYNETLKSIVESSPSSVNFDENYEQYSTCKGVPKNYLEDVKNALTVSHLPEGDVNTTKIYIDLYITTGFSQRYQPEGKIHEAYITKDYALMTVDELQDGIDESFLNWTRLLQSLTNSSTKFEQTLHVYFPAIIKEGISQMHNVDKRILHNALLGLYAHKLYNEFVIYPKDGNDYCERAAMTVFGTRARSFYLSSFSPEERRYMNETITKTFEELKTTMEWNLEHAPWLEATGDRENVALQKTRNLSITIPEFSSHYKDLEFNIDKDEFLNNTIMLQKDYRTTMYEILGKSPITDEQIWAHFALPYDTTGSAIYALDKIVVPFGIVDWKLVKTADQINAHHLTLATLGTKIAQQIARHFDPTGIKYFAGKRGEEHSTIFCGNENALQTYQDMTSTYDTIGEENIVLPATEKSVTYSITGLSLNQRFSDVSGLQLAYETMNNRPDSGNLLPWLNNEETDKDKQFFLAYAQTHCTKVPLTSSFVSFYENERLPSRLKLLAEAFNYETLGKTLKCHPGSKVLPGVSYNVFPHVKTGLL